MGDFVGPADAPKRDRGHQLLLILGHLLLVVAAPDEARQHRGIDRPGADDIDTHASTPQAKAAFNLIGSEVNNILTIIKTSLEPLYRLYELDPGMKKLDQNRRNSVIREFTAVEETADSYDEQALWADVKGKSQDNS